VFAEHFDVARVGLAETFEDLDRRGLAGTVRAEHAEAFAAMDLEAQAVQGHDVSVPLHERAAGESVHPDRFYVEVDGVQVRLASGGKAIKLHASGKRLYH
jgi:hypothetical protein